VAVQVAERQLTVALGQVVDAITMPAELASRVHAQLGIAMLAGPVIAHPDGHWTFLTQPATSAREDIVDGLAERDVRYAAPGTYALIPTELSDAGRRWIAEPRPNQMLPSPYAVVATARRVCAAVPPAGRGR